MGELAAVFGDINSHGGGELQCDNNAGKFFAQGKLVALINCSALPDSIPHPDPKPVTGSSKLFVGGIAVHRNNDLRNCGATTVVSNQSKLFVG